MTDSALTPGTADLPAFALTFDDGPGNGTAGVLDALRGAGIAATFFVLGTNVVEARYSALDPLAAYALLVRALREGHTLGSHLYTHAPTQAAADLAAEIRHVDALIERAFADAGVAPAPIPVRLPFGPRVVRQPGPPDTFIIDPRLAFLTGLGRTHVHWTGIFGDWAMAEAGADRLCAKMVAHVEEAADFGIGAVLCLHDGDTTGKHGTDRTATVRALEAFLRTARARDWRAFRMPTPAGGPQ